MNDRHATPGGGTFGETLESMKDTAAPVSETLGSLETLESRPPVPARDQLARPKMLGRYRILGELGRGGMGVVYEAHDPELERAVALKVLSSGHHGEVARARLRREARTLAKLAHPNVVAVHDVGEERGQLYLAMEMLEGGTLKDWGQSPRRWAEVLEVFVGAGRGLVAAHEAGLVHRDFKPDNVLLDELGQPRVVDFGLARVVEVGLEQTDTSPGDASLDSQEVLNSLTRPGAIMGTPAYMAPEQHLGDGTDARTDQFSFCVALWEALYGERPFPGKSLAALSDAVSSGRVSMGPRRGVPRAIRTALLRGLEADPRHRWPTLAELLAALEAVPRRRRMVAMSGVLGALAMGLVGGTWAFADQSVVESAPVCVDTGARVDAAWTSTRRVAVAGALDRAGGERAASTRELVLGRLDAYSSSLSAALEQACLDTEVRQLVSPKLRDRRVSCLSAGVDALDAAATLLESIDDRSGLRQVTRLVQALPPIERCADLSYLEARLPDPEQAEDAKRVAEARRQLARANAAISAVRIDEVDEALAQAEVARAGVEHPPLLVELAFARGRLATLRGEYDQAATLIEDSYHQALGLGHDELAIDASLEMIVALGYDLREPERGLVWARHAESMIERSGDELARAQLLHSRGRMYAKLDEPERALALFEEAVDLRARLLGRRSLPVGASLNDLSSALDDLDRRDEAREALKEAISIKLDTLGDHSTSTAGSLTNMGLLLWKAGEFDEAIAHHERALKVFEHAYGPKHRSVAGTSLNLAKALHSAGRARSALPVITRALDIVHEHEHAAPRLEAMLFNILAAAHDQLGRWELARQAYEDELAVLVGMHGEDSARLGSALLGLAEVANAAGEPRVGIEHAQRVLSLNAGDDGDSVQIADAHLSVAESLFAMGEGAKARAHALEARELFADAGGLYAGEREEVDVLLAKLGGQE